MLRAIDQQLLQIDAAGQAVRRGQQWLLRLRDELADIDLGPGLIEFDGAERFADYFFDGLIADWVAQSRINQSHERVAAVRGRVLSLIVRLEEEYPRARGRVSELGPAAWPCSTNRPAAPGRPERRAGWPGRR